MSASVKLFIFLYCVQFEFSLYFIMWIYTFTSLIKIPCMAIPNLHIFSDNVSAAANKELLSKYLIII